MTLFCVHDILVHTYALRVSLPKSVRQHVSKELLQSERTAAGREAKSLCAAAAVQARLASVNWSWQMHCYLLTRSGASKLMALNGGTITAPVDIHISQLAQVRHVCMHRKTCAHTGMMRKFVSVCSC